jgi:opacity protein-like surface antigen
VVGGGIEAALVGGWTAKAEALYLQSISRERQIFGIKVEDHVTDAVVRLGVNYRFGLPGY